MNFCSLRKTKGSVSEASATHVLSGLCAEWDLCCKLGQGLHTTHINGPLRCLHSLLGLVLFYPKVYQEMPELCHILWGQSFWTFYKFIQLLLHLAGPTLCQDIWSEGRFGIWHKPGVLLGLSLVLQPAESRPTVKSLWTISSFQFPPSRGLLSSEVLFSIYSPWNTLWPTMSLLLREGCTCIAVAVVKQHELLGLFFFIVSLRL